MIDLVKALRSRATWETAIGFTEPHQHINWIAAEEITRLREELAAAQSRITDLTKISATLNVRTSKLNALREENARLREALEEALPFVRIKGMWSEEIHDRIAAAIREGWKDG